MTVDAAWLAQSAQLVQPARTAQSDQSDQSDQSTGEGAGLLFVAWGAVAGRSAELARALGGSSVCFYSPGGPRRPVAMRYALSAARTLSLWWRRRPSVLVVTNPPLFPGLLAVGWARATGVPVILDSHPGAFGAMGDRLGARLLPLHRWLVRQVAFSLVADERWGELVEGWGGSAMVVHEAPVPFRHAPVRRHARLRVLYVGTFAGDEPVEELLAAAALVPQADVLVTGDLAQAPSGLVASAPANVRFVGFLGSDAYRQAVEEADVVLALTTEPHSVMRAAYEAVYAERPLIVSDWPVLRRTFSDALHAANDAASLAAAITEADVRHDELAAATVAARARQLDRWDRQARELDDRLAAACRRTSR